MHEPVHPVEVPGRHACPARRAPAVGDCQETGREDRELCSREVGLGQAGSGLRVRAGEVPAVLDGCSDSRENVVFGSLSTQEVGTPK
jgi:hypothetical protein